MQIYTFYSFKGGVGRSNLLYNVAYLLAAKHRARVVISDWDLHAPGMTCLYDMQDPDGPLLRRGIIDVLSDLADESKADADQITDPMELVHPTRIGRRIQEADPDAGDIWFLPAGAFAGENMDEYQNRVQGLREGMPGLVKRGRKELLPWVAERIEARFANEKKKPDYLLLDARTGLTEVGDLLLSKVTNRVIVVFGLNDQNIDGMGHTLRRILDDVSPANIASQVLLVVSPVPNGEEYVKQQRRRRIDDVVKGIVNRASELAEMKKPVYPERLEVPYHPLIALTERPMAEVYPQSEPAKAFEAVTERLRTRPLKAEAVQQEIQLRVREEQLTTTDIADEKAPESMRMSPDATHPMARSMPWNVVHPEATPDLLLRTKVAEGEELLEGLANTVSVSVEARGNIIERTPASTALQRHDLLRLLAEERAHFMAMDKKQWPGVASLRAQKWVDWVFESARRLGVASDLAAQRWADWLLNPPGRPMNSALVAAAAGEIAKKPDATGAARTLLERAVEANPDDTAFRLYAAGQRIRLGDIERGNEWFQRAAEGSEPEERVEFAWGVALQKRAENVSKMALEEALRLLYAEAETHYGRAVEREPDKHEAENNWGNTIAKRARLLQDREPDKALQLFEEAEQHHRRAVELKPESHEAESNWGNTIAARAPLLQEQEPDRAVELYKEAERHYRRAIEIKPDMHEAENNWGNTIAACARLLQGREPDKVLQLFEEAELHYRRAIEIKPDKHDAEFNWGNVIADRARLLQGREPAKALELFEEAERHYRRALEIKPDMHEAADNLVATLCGQTHVLRALGRPDDAARAAKKALRIAQDQCKATGKPTYNLACALAQNGDVEEALTTLETLAQGGELKDPAWMRKDPDLEALRANPRFEELVKGLETR